MSVLYGVLAWALERMQVLLTVFDPYGTIAAVILTAVALVRSAAKEGLLAPTIAVECIPNEKKVVVLVRNFEAIEVVKAVNVRVGWKLGWELCSVTFRAGPWRRRPLGDDNGEGAVHDDRSAADPAVVLRFGGLPADSAVMATLEFDRAIPRDTITIGPGTVPDQSGDETLKLGHLATLKPFSRVNALLHYWKRLLLGIGGYLVGAAYLYRDEGKISQVDAAIAVGGLVLVCLAWFVALPLQGKDTVCGYDGDVTWKPGP